jgi:hypothetical protein
MDRQQDELSSRRYRTRTDCDFPEENAKSQEARCKMRGEFDAEPDRFSLAVAAQINPAGDSGFDRRVITLADNRKRTK